VHGNLGQASTAGARELPERISPRDVARLRAASFGALTTVIIQSVLGTAYNLYGTAPTSKKSIGLFSSGPVLALHVVVAILLLISAIVLLVRAILARHRAVIVTSAIGLLAIIAAAGAGIGFAKNGASGGSMGMDIAAAVALLCYAINLFILGSRPVNDGL
jgi:heme A synthase